MASFTTSSPIAFGCVRELQKIAKYMIQLILVLGEAIAQEPKDESKKT